jgi:hypothetical protein
MACARGAAVTSLPGIFEPLLVVAPAVDLPESLRRVPAPVAAARVTLPSTGALDTVSLPRRGYRPDIRTDADAEGRFRLPRAPGTPDPADGLCLGILTRFLKLDGSGNTSLVIVLPEDPVSAHGSRASSWSRRRPRG